MRIELTIETDNICDLQSEELMSVTERISSLLKLKKPHAIIEVFLVSDEKIKEINSKFRGINEITDVLSFPQQPFRGEHESVLGSIFIAPKFAKNQGVECKKLFVHGLLHLSGFDHEKNILNWEAAEKAIGWKTL